MNIRWYFWTLKPTSYTPEASCFAVSAKWVLPSLVPSWYRETLILAETLTPEPRLRRRAVSFYGVPRVFVRAN